MNSVYIGKQRWGHWQRRARRLRRREVGTLHPFEGCVCNRFGCKWDRAETARLAGGVCFSWLHPEPGRLRPLYPALRWPSRVCSFAAMNAQKTCALDRRPRCGCFCSYEKKCLFLMFHMHARLRRSVGIRGAPGSVLEQDTIPKPRGLAEPLRGPVRRARGRGVESRVRSTTSRSSCRSP